MTLTALSMRERTAADAAACKALRDHALLHHDEAFTADAPVEAARAAHGNAARLGADAGASFTPGAFEGDRLVGATTCDRGPRAKLRHIGHLTGMLAHGNARGRGVGYLLMERPIERAADEKELHRRTRHVGVGNDAARRLCERAGFVRYGILSRDVRARGSFLDEHHTLRLLK